jgi:hypothetical protein
MSVQQSEEFCNALGLFIYNFSEIEKLLFFYLLVTAKIPISDAKAIFSEARIDKVKQTVNRLRQARNVPEDDSRAYPMSSSITAIACRGKRHGATKTASPRQVNGAAQGFEPSQVLAAREIRCRLISSIAALASSSVGRTFTSTKAIVSARRATMSISPPRMR